MGTQATGKGLHKTKLLILSFCIRLHKHRASIFYFFKGQLQHFFFRCIYALKHVEYEYNKNFNRNVFSIDFWTFPWSILQKENMLY